MGKGTGLIDDASFRAAADAFYAEGMGLCILWTRQGQIQDFVQIILNHAGAVLGQNRRTGLFELRPIRGDYDVEDLPLFDESNVLIVDNYQRPAVPGAINEVTVVFTELTTNKDAGITVQNLANITSQGGIVSESKRYPGLPTADLAARVAMRDLKSVSTPLARVRMQVNRQGYNILPGDVIRWNWPKLGIENLVLRVLTAGAGTVTDGAILLECGEDVFGLPTATYVAQEPSGWQDPSTAPAVAPYRLIQEASYFQILRTMSPGDLSVLPDDAGFVSTLAVRPSSDSVRYRILSRFTSGTTYIDGGSGDFCPTGLLTASLDKVATTLTLNGMVNADLVIVPDGKLYAYLDGEIIRIDAFSAVTGVATIGRGCFDTVAAAHASGARLYFGDGYEASDRVERVDGDSVLVKLLPATGRGVLLEALAPSDTVVMDQRHFRAYPPGRLRINSLAYPSSISDAPLLISWNHRSRLQQNLEGDEAGSIGPEPGTTYTVQIFNDATSALITQQSGLTGSSVSFSSIVGTFTLRIEVFSVRDGLASRQRHSHVMSYTMPGHGTAPGVTRAATASLIPGSAFGTNAIANGANLVAFSSMMAGGAGSGSGTLTLQFGGTTYTAPDGGSVDLQFSPTTYLPPPGG
jgi:hypothetical protein